MRVWLGRVIGLAVLAGLAAADASAEVRVAGALSPRGCVVDDTAAVSKGCSKVTGLKDAAFLAASPSGRHLYVSSRTSGTVTVFAVSSATGKLTKRSCVAPKSVASTLQCTAMPGLGVPTGVVVSPDGRNLYVASSSGNALLALRRRKSGQLRFLSCFATGPTADPSCTAVPRLSAPIGIALTSDGRHLYVTSKNAAVLTFSRRSDGRLTFASCVQSSGFDGCLQSGELYSPSWLAAAADGRHVYATDSSGNSVFAFTRDVSSGALTATGCWSGLSDGSGKTGSCAAARGLNNPEYLALSPDGLHVYVSGSANAVAIFRRDAATGQLSQTPDSTGCIGDWTTSMDDCIGSDALGTPFGLAFDPTGRHMYVGAYGSNSAAMFERDPVTGALGRHARCYATAEPLCRKRGAMAGAGHVAVTPDGRYVYVAAPKADAIHIFARTATAPFPRLIDTSLAVRRGASVISLFCPKQALLGCFGTVTAKVLDSGGRPAGAGDPLSFDVRPATTARLVWKLDAAARAALRATKHDVVRIQVTSRPPAGRSVTFARWVTARVG